MQSSSDSAQAIDQKVCIPIMLWSKANSVSFNLGAMCPLRCSGEVFNQVQLMLMCYLQVWHGQHPFYKQLTARVYGRHAGVIALPHCGVFRSSTCVVFFALHCIYGLMHAFCRRVPYDGAGDFSMACALFKRIKTSGTVYCSPPRVVVWWCSWRLTPVLLHCR